MMKKKIKHPVPKKNTRPLWMQQVTPTKKMQHVFSSSTHTKNQCPNCTQVSVLVFHASYFLPYLTLKAEGFCLGQRNEVNVFYEKKDTWESSFVFGVVEWLILGANINLSAAKYVRVLAEYVTPVQRAFTENERKYCECNCFHDKTKRKSNSCKVLSVLYK